MKLPISSWKMQWKFSSHKQTISRQVKFFLLLIFALLLTIGIFVLVYIRNQYIEDLYTISGWNASSIMGDIDNAIKNTESIGELIIGDVFFQDRLSLIKDGDNPLNTSAARRDIQSRISIMIDAVDYVSDIAVFDGEAIQHHGSGISLSDEEFRKAVDRAMALDGDFFWLDGHEREVYYVRAIRRAESLALDTLGILFLRLELGEAMDNQWTISGLSGAVDLFYGGQLIYSDGMIPDGYETRGRGVEVALSGFSSYFIHEGMMHNEWEYRFYSNADYDAGNESIFYTAVLFLLAMMLLSLLTIHLYSRSLLKHLDVLSEKMDRFGEGNMDFSDLPSYADRNDELGDLHKHFDQMVIAYNDLVRDNYTKEILARDSMLRMLSQQINPHFLYNVLDSMYWLAERYKAEDIAKMSYSLANLFRTSISGSELVVPLSKELEFVHHYVEIQTIRFSDMFSFEYTCPDELLSVNVPRFSIQPLVENAVKHAVEENGEVCHVHLSAAAEGNDVVVSISNTGSQFPDDMDLEKKGRIGLKNINQRLTLLFGDEYALRFSNENGEAVVSFKVPGSME